MTYVIDVNQLEAIPGKNSDNKPIVRRDNLKISLLDIRPHAEISVHAHNQEEQFYYVISGEGIIRLGDRNFPLGPGIALDMPPASCMESAIPTMSLCATSTYLSSV